MVNSLKLIKSPSRQFNYLRDESNKQISTLVQKLQEGIEFKPGLNYIIGENGCGKSTILNMIRSINRCEHSFIPTKDHFSITTISEVNELLDCIELKQDYRIPVFNLYRYKHDTERINGELESRDEVNLFMANKQESSGQNLMGDINQLFNWMFERYNECYPMMKYIKDIHESGSFTNIDNKYENSQVLIDRIKELNIKDEPPTYTLLMDEPDQGLDIDNLKEVYGVISFDKPQTQLIAVIHNPLLIYKLHNEVQANWIELSDGHLNRVLDSIDYFIK